MPSWVYRKRAVQRFSLKRPPAGQDATEFSSALLRSGMLFGISLQRTPLKRTRGAPRNQYRIHLQVNPSATYTVVNST